MQLLMKDEVYAVVGAAMEVHSQLGPGFLEAVYQRALAIEFRRRNIPYGEKPRLNIFYKDEQLSCIYVPDYTCYGQIIVELKASARCTAVDQAQLLNVLKVARAPVGLLLNFGQSSLYYKRFANTRGKRQ